ncbi:hypothetical protein WDU94_015003 [Cyamophila willieti]
MFRQGRAETEEERIARIKRQNEEIRRREQKIIEDKKFAEALGADFKAKVPNWPSDPSSYPTPPRNHVTDHTPPFRKVRPPRQSNGGRDGPPPDPRSFLADEERDYECEELGVPNRFNSSEKQGNDFGGRRNDRRRGGSINRRLEVGGREERTQGSPNDLRNRLRDRREWEQDKVEEPDDVVSPAAIHSEPRRRGARGASTSLARGGNIIRRVIVNDIAPNPPKMSEVDEILERITEVHLEPSNTSNCDDIPTRPYPPALMDVTFSPLTRSQYKETQPSSQHTDPNAYPSVNEHLQNQAAANQQLSGGSYPDHNYAGNDARSYGNQHMPEQSTDSGSFPYQQAGSYTNQGSYNDIPDKTQYATQHVHNHGVHLNQRLGTNPYVNQTVLSQGTNTMVYEQNQASNSKSLGIQPLPSQAKNSVSYTNQGPQNQIAPTPDLMAFANQPLQTHVIHSGAYTNHGLQGQVVNSPAFTNPIVQNHVNTVTYANHFPPNQGGLDSTTFTNQPPQKQVQNLAANHVSQNPNAHQFPPTQVADPPVFANSPSITQVPTMEPYMSHSSQNHVHPVTYANHFSPNQCATPSTAFVNQPGPQIAHASNQAANVAAYANLASQIHANQVAYANQPPQNQAPNAKHQPHNQEGYANQYSLNQQLAEQEYKNKLTREGVNQFVVESNYTPGPQENIPRQNNMFGKEPVISDHTVHQQTHARRAITSIPVDSQTLFSEHATHPAAPSTDIPTLPVLPDFSVPPPPLAIPPKTIPSTTFVTKVETDQSVSSMEQYVTPPSEGYVTVTVVSTVPQYMTAPSQSTPYVSTCQPHIPSQRQPAHAEPPQNHLEMYGTFQSQSAAFATSRNESAPYETCQNQPDLYGTHQVQSASYVTSQNQAASSKSDSTYESSQSVSTHNVSAYATSQGQSTPYETCPDMYGTHSAPYSTSQPSSYVSTQSYMDTTGVVYQENPTLAYEDGSSMNPYESQQQVMSMDSPYESEKRSMESQYEPGNDAGVTSNQQFERKNEFHQDYRSHPTSVYYGASEVSQSQSVPPTLGNQSVQNRLQRIKHEKATAAAVPEPTRPETSSHTADSFTPSQSVKKTGGKTKNFSFLKQAIRQNQENLKEYLAENQEVTSVETVQSLVELNTGHSGQQTEGTLGHRGHQNEVTSGHRGHRTQERHEGKQGFKPGPYQDQSSRFGDNSSSLRNRNIKRPSPNNMDSNKSSSSNKFVTNFDDYDKLDFDSVGGRPLAHPSRSRAPQLQGNAPKSFTTIESMRGNAGRHVESYLQEKLAKAKQSQDRGEHRGVNKKQEPFGTDKTRVSEVRKTDSSRVSDVQTSGKTKGTSSSSPPKPTSSLKKLNWIAECENSEELREREARANGKSLTNSGTDEVNLERDVEKESQESNSLTNLQKYGENETQVLADRDRQTNINQLEEANKDQYTKNKHEKSTKIDTQQEDKTSIKDEGKSVKSTNNEEKSESKKGEEEEEEVLVGDDEEWEDVSDEEDKKKNKNKKYGGRYYGRYGY